MEDGKCKQATPHGTLIEQVMNPCLPKSEREWAASREIDRLRGWLKLMVHCYENDNQPNVFILQDIKLSLNLNPTGSKLRLCPHGYPQTVRCTRCGE
jgi:hypothetical protein